MKKLVCLFLTLVFLCSTVAFSVTGVFAATSEHTTFELGSYPQTQVRDVDTVLALNELIDNNNWIGFYQDTTNSTAKFTYDYYAYQDINYSGDKYRAIKQIASSYSSTFDSENSTVYWYKFEPITWRLLDSSTGLAVSVDVLDSRPFSNKIYEGDIYNDRSNFYTDSSCLHFANDYSVSFVRGWLNNDFYNLAFSAQEKQLILPSSNENKPYTIDDINCNYDTTVDSVFLLSAKEAYDTREYSTGFNSTGYSKFFQINSYRLLRSGSGLLNNGGDCYCCYNSDISFSAFVTAIGGIKPAIKIAGQVEEYTVTYNANGGYGAPSEQTKSQFQDLILSDETPYRDGYIFKGWSTGSSEIKYMPGDTYSENRSITLYAIWQKQTFTITYKVDNQYYAEQSYGYGDSINPLQLPREAGIRYSSWSPSIPAKMPSYSFTVSSTGYIIDPSEDELIPRIRINEETNYWEVSYDKGETWISLGVKATGENGQNGIDGVGIQTVELNENGELVITLTNGNVFNLGKITGSDGKDGTDGKDGVDGKDGTDGKDGADGKDGVDGKDGKDGKDGATITSMYYNANGELVIKMSDGSEINAGKPSGSAYDTNMDRPTVTISGYQSSRSIDYGTSITFHSNASYIPEGYSLHWFVNGEDKGTSNSLTVNNAASDFTVCSRLMKNGSTLSESKVEKVTVKSDFFSKIIAFFKKLFNPNSFVIDQK